MTKRERYLKAMHNQPTDQLVWAPNFDYWYRVNSLQKTIPEKYTGMSVSDITRKMDACIWMRAPGLETIFDSSIKINSFTQTDKTFCSLQTQQKFPVLPKWKKRQWQYKKYYEGNL